METESSDEGPERIGFHQLGICVSVCTSGCARVDKACLKGKEGGIVHKLQIKAKKKVLVLQGTACENH